MSDNIILTDRHNGLVICTIPLVPLYKDMNGYVGNLYKDCPLAELTSAYELECLHSNGQEWRLL